MNKLTLMARCALVCGAMLALSPAVLAAEVMNPNDPCLKRVFEKTTSTGRWLVKECAGKVEHHFKVEFRDAKLQQYSAMFSDDDPSSIVGENYMLVAPDTLALDLMAERGGRVFLVHPVGGTNELSTVRVDYMNPDEGGKFNLKKTGNNIRLVTNEDDVTVVVDAEGRLSKMSKPRKKKP